ncbi:DegV family protein [Lactobacillus acidophilus DSM 9126]|nr:DegV family protein [Lactobacillus acidophilus DSM 9126]
MSKIKVMTDSSVQLTPEEIKKYNITVVPLTITIDGHSYIDGVDITRSDFVKKMN